MIINRLLFFFLSNIIFGTCAMAQDDLINAVHGRSTTSLNGKWQYIIDPYETGFFDYRYKELPENSRSAYWAEDTLRNKADLKEFGYTEAQELMVPGDWNHQEKRFEYYEGTVWYRKLFDYQKLQADKKLFVYFGAVNYRADVYLNGKKLGSHEGGFTPFNFEVPANLLREKNNFLVVKVDNKRHEDDVPTLNTDWWNYGGITREVLLVEVPSIFIKDFSIQLNKGKPGSIPATKNTEVVGSITLNMPPGNAETISIAIPELKFRKEISAGSVATNFKLSIPKLQLWEIENPKLYKIIISTKKDTVIDQVGFRTIEAFDEKVLLNGRPVFMRGISIHGEIPQETRRANSAEDALQLLMQAKELGCNMVRLAHYPHDETMTRLADSLGLLVWSEIPVYWTINFASKAVYNKAEKQLREMISRDHNRASIIIWSVGNETPISENRTQFMHALIDAARALDSSRLISAALEVNYGKLGKTNVVDDPLGAFVDIVAFNEYLGWYGGMPDQCRTTSWSTPYKKPFFISETGAGAKGGFHADSLTRFSEEFQEWYYKEQVAMLQRMPANFVGISPWVLNDFRSPKRNNPIYQQGWNRKGLYGDQGNKKKAFYILQAFYQAIKDKKLFAY